MEIDIDIVNKIMAGVVGSCPWSKNIISQKRCPFFVGGLSCNYLIFSFCSSEEANNYFVSDVWGIED